jgi:hypothetical protein
MLCSGWEGGRKDARSLDKAGLTVPLKYKLGGVHSHKCLEMDLGKSKNN